MLRGSFDQTLKGGKMPAGGKPYFQTKGHGAAKGSPGKSQGKKKGKSAPAAKSYGGMRVSV